MKRRNIMKTTKRVLAIVLAALMLLCLASCSDQTVSADGTKIEEVEHVFTSDGNSKFEYDFTEVNTVKITGYTGSFEIHAVTVPAAIVYNEQEYPVTESTTFWWGFAQSMVNSLGSGLGFMLAMIMFSGVRSKLEGADIPKAFRGLPITLVAASITSLSFVGFGGVIENLFA